MGAAATVMWSGPATCKPPAEVPASRPREAPASQPREATNAPSTTPSPTPARAIEGSPPAVPGLDTRSDIAASAQTEQPPAPPPAGTVGVPIRLAEPSALRLVRVGDRVDVFRAGDGAKSIADGALVLAVTGVDDPLTGGLLVALPPAAARETVKPAQGGYAVVIRPDG